MLLQAQENDMAKLTDSQLVILSKAAQRDGGAAVIPSTFNRAAATKVGASLVARKLMRDVLAKADMPIWRNDQDGRSLSLVLLRAGREAIGVENDANGTEQTSMPAKGDSKVVDVEPPPSSAKPRPGSKQAMVISMLSKDLGATLDALVEATGWATPHDPRCADGPSQARLRDRAKPRRGVGVGLSDRVGSDSSRL